MSYVDRRREVRYCVDFMCTAGVDKVEMKVNDISIHGISIIGSAIFYQLHAVDIDIKLSRFTQIQLHAVVRDCIETSNGFRYGLEIFDTPTKWLKLVSKYEKMGDKISVYK